MSRDFARLHAVRYELATLETGIPPCSINVPSIYPYPVNVLIRGMSPNSLPSLSVRVDGWMDGLYFQQKEHQLNMVVTSPCDTGDGEQRKNGTFVHALDFGPAC